DPHHQSADRVTLNKFYVGSFFHLCFQSIAPFAQLSLAYYHLPNVNQKSTLLTKHFACALFHIEIYIRTIIFHISKHTYCNASAKKRQRFQLMISKIFFRHVLGEYSVI